jgi:hypothetical protein
VCDCRQNLDWWIHLLTTYTHDSQVQAITVPPLISTIHKSPEHTPSLFQPAVSSPAVPWQGLLTVEILQRHSLHSLPCRNGPTEQREQRRVERSDFTTGVLPPIRSSRRQAPWDSGPVLFWLNTCGHSTYVTSSLTRGWFCLLQLLVAELWWKCTTPPPRRECEALNLVSLITSRHGLHRKHRSYIVPCLYVEGFT